jgi:N-formylglutamate amidohydrolase
MGLGTIARIVASGEEIYSEKLRFVEAQRRIERLYRPYHQALRGLVEETAALFGGCLLVDCHSMPSGADSPCEKSGADIVLGDCHGASCAPQFVEAARRFLVEHGFAVAINAPYAGGFTTGHYGRPSVRRHALQIEVNRALYMNERDYERKAYFPRLVQDLAELIDRLGRVAQECLKEAAQPAQGDRLTHRPRVHT